MISTHRFFACLSEEIRLASMLLVHRAGELCVCELVAALEENQPKVSRHLAQLRNCGLLEDRRQGQWVFYRLAPQLPPWALRVLEEAAGAETVWLTSMEQRLAAMSGRPDRAVACG